MRQYYNILHAKYIAITYKIQSIYFKINGYNFKNSCRNNSLEGLNSQLNNYINDFKLSLESTFSWAA